MNDNELPGMPEDRRRCCARNSYRHNMEARRGYARRWAPLQEAA